MDQQKQIQFLKPLLKSKNKIAKHLGINRETVSKYWEETIPTGVLSARAPDWSAHIDWEYYKKEVGSGVSIKILYKEFSQVQKLPTYANFARYCRLYESKKNMPTISLKVDRSPGHSIEIDYGGDKIEIYNPSTGEIIEANLFVAALSYSSYFYAEFTLTQRQEDFLSSCRNTFEHLGSAPQFIISDNCKTAVTKAEKHDSVLNKTFNDFCEHYNIIADPARAYHPKDKPNVENAVGVIQKEFFQKHRHRTFTSLMELNLVLHEYLAEKMNEKIPERQMSRNELLAFELPKMKDLPLTPYELSHYKICKVHPDIHIRHDRNYYSIPCRLVGREVQIKYNGKMIYAYSGVEQVAVHALAIGHGHYITNESHYPDNKLIDTNYHIQSSLVRSRKIGENTELLVKKIFAVAKAHPLRNLTKAQGILALADKYKTEAIEYGAEAALEANTLNYNFVKNCAKNFREKKSEQKLLPNRQLEFVCLQGGLS